MRFVRCALCGSDNYQVLANQALYGVQCRNVVCADCGLGYVNPRMEESDLRAFYHSGYRERQFSQSQPTEDFLRKAAREADERLAWTSPYLVKQAPVLEVGCGTGNYLETVRRKTGNRVMGIEPTATYADYGTRQLGLEIRRTFFEDTQLPQNNFGAIALFHVLEHLEDPAGSLGRFNRALVSDGYLILEVPNLLKPWDYLTGFLEDVHLYNFTPVTLTGILHKAGFRVVWLSDAGVVLRCVARKSEQSNDWQPDPRHAGQVIAAVRRSNAKYIARHPVWAIRRGLRNIAFGFLGDTRARALQQRWRGLKLRNRIRS